MPDVKEGFEYRVQWKGVGEPPEGMAPVQLRMFSRTRTCPPEIEARLLALGLGSGWAVCFQILRPPPKRWSEAHRGEARRGGLRRRVERTIGPMFSEEVIRAELATNSGDFSGATRPDHAAYLAGHDAVTARTWQAYLDWLHTHGTREDTPPPG